MISINQVVNLANTISNDFGSETVQTHQMLNEKNVFLYIKYCWHVYLDSSLVYGV